MSPSATLSADASPPKAPRNQWPEPPAVLDRPPFAFWLWERGINHREAGDVLGKSREWVRSICLPWSDPKRVTPRLAEAMEIEDWTRGAIPCRSWVPPQSEARP